jgi:hypothetical protein
MPMAIMLYEREYGFSKKQSSIRIINSNLIEIIQMKKDYCEIIMVLDESGSMSSCKSDTVGGVNEFLNNQKRLAGEVKVTLVKFSDYYKVINDAAPLQQIEYLNDHNYTPSNTTALLDAVGKTINKTGQRLAAMKEKNRPEKVIFVIITDGFENASQEFSQSEVFKMVTHQKEKYSWEFTFLGADIDTWGEEIGIVRNVKIGKNDLKRSFKGLSVNVLHQRLFINDNVADYGFDKSEEELDKDLNSIGEIE